MDQLALISLFILELVCGVFAASAATAKSNIFQITHDQSARLAARSHFHRLSGLLMESELPALTEARPRTPLDGGRMAPKVKANFYEANLATNFARHFNFMMSSEHCW